MFEILQSTFASWNNFFYTLLVQEILAVFSIPSHNLLTFIYYYHYICTYSYKFITLVKIKDNE